MIKTGCPYCGVGCGLVAEVRDGRLHAVRGDEEHPVNRGLTCRKPLALPEASRVGDRALTAAAARGRDASLPRRRRGTTRSTTSPRGCARLHARGDRVLHLRPAADRGLLRGQQAGQGLPAAPTTSTRNSRLCMSRAVAGYDAVVRRRRSAAGVRRPRADRLHPAARLQHLGLPPDPVGAHPRGAGARREADRRRPAPHGRRGRRRHPPADQARHRPRAAQRADRRARARGGVGRGARGFGLRRRRGRHRARGRAVRRGPVDGAVVDGRQPVRRGRRDQPRAAEPVRRHRARSAGRAPGRCR